MHSFLLDMTSGCQNREWRVCKGGAKCTSQLLVRDRRADTGRFPGLAKLACLGRIRCCQTPAVRVAAEPSDDVPACTSGSIDIGSCKSICRGSGRLMQWQWLLLQDHKRSLLFSAPCNKTQRCDCSRCPLQQLRQCLPCLALSSKATHPLEE